ncbi:MAG: hypothetical protein ABSD62_03780 [Candidatus Limnocylindrales bacterium]
MPQDRQSGTAADGRAAPPATAKAPACGLDARTVRDHRAISNLADDLLPALIAKLAASGLGEIEVREGGWKARLRKPSGADDRRAAGRSSVDGHSVHAHGPGRGPAASLTHTAAEERDRLTRDEEEAEESANLPIVATSPAVGVYHPRKDLSVGMRVRAGDRLGAVDVLGVREDVVAPVDGVIGLSLAEAGEAVEYGQELIRIELPENSRSVEINGADREAAAVLGEA